MPSPPIPPSPTRGKGILEAHLARLRASKADSLIPEHLRGGRLLDIGSGSHPYFLLSTEFAEKYGMDLMAEPEEYQGSLKLFKHDFTHDPKLPFEDNHFEAVTMLAVFEHIEPRVLHLLILDVHRVLKPGGVFVLTTPAGWADGLLRLMAKLRLVSAVEIADHKDTYTPRKVASVLEASGFRRHNIRCGLFEVFLNIWARASKEGANRG